MSFLPKHGFSSYKIQKLNVSTRNKADVNASDLEYEVALPEAITNVISITLVDYSFPSYIFAAFQSKNDTLDFSLQNPSINGGLPTIFSVVFPHTYMDYQNIKKSSSYIDILETLINDAISSNPTWNGKVDVTLLWGNNFESFFLIDTISPLASDSTVMTLLFSSGPNKDKSAYMQMGFLPDIDVSSIPILYLSLPSQIIQAPLETNLKQNKFIDVYVDEIGSEPIKRIFSKNESYATNFFSTENILSLDVITNNPPRNIDKLHIKIIPDTVLDTRPFPHAFTFHIVSLDNGVLSIPTYVKQRLSY